MAAGAGNDAVASKASASSGIDEVCKHEWRKHHSVWPFWVIPRVNTQEKANLVLTKVLSRIVTAHAAIGKAGGEATTCCEVGFPVMTNPAKITKGTALVVFQPVPDAPKQPPEKKQKTWEDDARKEHNRRAKQQTT